MTRIELDDGKYTVVHDSGAGLHALRYGEHWRDMTGDGLVLAMAQEIEDLRRRIVPVQQVSVPECFTKLLHHAHGMTMGVDWNTGTMASYHREPLGEAAVQCQAWLAAAPAAPAADAGLELDRNEAYQACPDSGCDWGSFWQGWKARHAGAQAIIDGLRDEVERLERAEKNDSIAYKAVLERQDELRAELAATKAQGLVIPAELDRAFITGESCDGVYRVAIQSETLKEMQAVHSWLTSLNAAPAAPAADGWIPVGERLPAVESRLDQECRVGTLSIAPLNVSVAVLVFDGEKVRSTRLEWFDGCLPLPYCITHWMPLPAAPAANSAKGVV